MIAIKEKEFQKTFFWISAILFAVLGFIIIKPYLSAILGSAILTYVFYPLYSLLLKRIPKRHIAALLTCLIVVALLLTPLFFILNTLTREAYVGYIVAKQKLTTTESLLPACQTADPLCNAFNSLNGYLSEPKVRYQLQSSIEKASQYVINAISGLVLSIPRFLINMFIIIFSMYYMFKDGRAAMGLIMGIAPLSRLYKKHLFEKVEKVTYAIIYGYIIVAIIQGAFATLGFFIFRIQSPILLGIVIAFLALIPFIGPAVIWAPIALYKLFNGISAQNNNEIVLALVFALYSAIFISGLETFLKSKIIGDKAQIHPLVILIGVLGGLSLSGLVGIVLGPLVLASAYTFFKLYQTDKRILE